MLLHGIAVMLIRCIAVAKGHDGRNWLILAVAFLPVAAVAISALPNRVLYQRICEIRDAAQLMVKGSNHDVLSPTKPFWLYGLPTGAADAVPCGPSRSLGRVGATRLPALDHLLGDFG